MVREVEDLEEFQAILKGAGDKLVVVDFTASWCGSCKKIAPVYAVLAEDPEFNNVIFLKVDVDEASDVSSFYGIRSMPTFQFFKNNVKVDEFSGADEDQLQQKLAELK